VATLEVLWGNIYSTEVILARSIIQLACFVKRGEVGLDPVCGASSPRLLPSIDDEIDGVSHLLPRIFASTSLSPLSGFLSEKETIKALKTSTKCRFPDLHADSIRKVILIWSDFITRCSMFTSQCTWYYHHPHIKPDALRFEHDRVALRCVTRPSYKVACNI
jgi:hypothetical protein